MRSDHSEDDDDVVPDSPTLGVCIPIYKRPLLLRRTLASIIESGREFQIPIFLSDDSCDDTNRDVIEEMMREYPHIMWQRNPANLGIDRNVQRSVEIATSEYVWLFGEDDVMDPDAVTTVMRVLVKDPYPFVFANYRSVSNDYQRTTRVQAVNLEQDGEYDAGDFLGRFGWATGFLGACVIERRLWNAVRKERYTGTYFSHVGTIFEAVHGMRIYAIARPIVMNRAENAESFTWAEQALQVTYGWRDVLTLLGKIYGAELTKRAALSGRVNFKGHSIMWLLSRRADGAFSIREWRAFVSGSSDGCMFRYGALLVSLIPRSLLKPVKRLLKS